MLLRNYYSTRDCNPKRTRRSILRTKRSNAAVDDGDDGRAKKRVSFASKIAEERGTISLKEMTEKEKRNSWHRERELVKIQKRCRRLVLADKQKEKFGGDDDIKNENGDCMRGLEHLRRRRTNILAGRDEVLITQRSQRSAAAVHEGDGEQNDRCNYRDDDAIATAYGVVASECRRLAELAASRDREEVQSFFSVVAVAAKSA